MWPGTAVTLRNPAPASAARGGEAGSPSPLSDAPSSLWLREKASPHIAGPGGPGEQLSDRLMGEGKGMPSTTRRPRATTGRQPGPRPCSTESSLCPSSSPSGLPAPSSRHHPQLAGGCWTAFPGEPEDLAPRPRSSHCTHWLPRSTMRVGSFSPDLRNAFIGRPLLSGALQKGEIKPLF